LQSYETLVLEFNLIHTGLVCIVPSVQICGEEGCILFSASSIGDDIKLVFVQASDDGVIDDTASLRVAKPRA
jgi:hypothetical protein